MSPTPEGGLQLARFLLEKGDIEQAESIWNKYAGQKMSADDMQNNMRQLLLNGEIEKVVGLIERALKNSPDDWEVLTVCMQMYYRCEKDTEATALANKLMELKLPGDTLSESAKRQRSRQAAGPQSSANTSGRTTSALAIALGLPTATNATATDRMACMSRAMQIVQGLMLERTNTVMMLRQMGYNAPSLVCFRDAKLVALYFCKGVSGNRAVPAGQAAPGTQPQTEDLTALSKETNVDKLWEDAFLAQIAQQSQRTRNVQSLPQLAGGIYIGSTIYTPPTRLPTSASPTSGMTPYLKRLAELDDQQAQLWLIGEALRQLQIKQQFRQNNLAMQINPATGMPIMASGPISIDAKNIDEYLALLQKVQAQATNAQNDSVLLLSIYLADELKSLKRPKESQQLLDSFRQNSRTAPKISQAIALANLDIDLAIDTFLAAVKQAPVSSAASGPVVFTTQGMEAGNFLQEALDRPRAVAGLETESASASINRSNPLRLITELKKLQAERARRMRPSQLSSYTPSNPVRYMVRSNNSNRGNSIAIVPFPAPSALQSSELLIAMYLVQQDQNNLYRGEMEKLLRAEAAQADDDAIQSAVDHLCLSIWLWWNGEKEESLKEMEIVRQTAAVNDLASMLASRMYFETGQLKESLAQLESLKPTTAQLMQERELAILQLASQAGDKALAKQAAERLFAMRLPSANADASGQSNAATRHERNGQQHVATAAKTRRQSNYHTLANDDAVPSGKQKRGRGGNRSTDLASHAF